MKGKFIRIDIGCSSEDAQVVLEHLKGELGRRVFNFLEKRLNGALEVHLTIKVNEQHSERIWSRE